MQYVRNLSDSVSTAWNSINPATLSGAIDVIVVEQEDGSLMCSPFHVRFGKFSLLRPYEKKVEFKVNGARQDYSMKLGEGGEAFFVFETTDNIPQSMQTSPISSPVSSPSLSPQASLGLGSAQLQEPELLALDSAGAGVKSRSSSHSLRSPPTVIPTILAASAQQRNGLLTPLSASPETYAGNLKAGDWSAWSQRAHSDDVLPKTLHQPSDTQADSADGDATSTRRSERSRSPPPLAPPEALERALTLSRELSSVNIPSRVTDSGDLMLDLTSFKGSEEDALRAEILARRVLSNELQGNYDVGALFGMDEQGNLWIYSSEEAKEAAMKRVMESSMGGGAGGGNGSSGPLDAVSDPGYQSDDSSGSVPGIPKHRRTESDVGGMADRNTPPSSPGLVSAVGDPNRNYAKTLRLTSDQLKALDLQPGENTMSFTVNRATCSAYMYLWKNDVPVVISDIDGTITKSDALGHVLNMIGRDWTHAGVAKLYSDIVANGYNIMYLTSRSVGQADSTRTYLHGILQGGYRLPRGPTILSPDRTMAALRREIYLRKPEVFKMATLRDIRNLYGSNSHPFYAGFGNRLTDQISYRTVDVPRNRIFTINANAEVSLDLLSLNQLKLTYVNITEVVDHYFPPVSTLVKGGGEDYTDFRYWRDAPLELDDFSASESGDDDIRGRRTTATHSHSRYEVEEEEEEDEEMDEEDDLDDEEAGEGMGDSYISRNSMDEYGEGSILSGEYDNDGHMMDSMIAEEHDEEVNLADSTPANGRVSEASQVSEATTTTEDVGAELITGIEKLSVEVVPAKEDESAGAM
ncbi:nuclear elongation and deformation protein 1 [Grosmannia clavigera kw1407]|uniref:Nuclear elongation and deformation protein 1 n=1 Tax=Grosmannia clavigera (strain kw1407 / UAMH 11150) TaxID=655863 RepID=F0XDG4_GROCL|nr:nuclear elongation and deformation protein 1 [Grosmannia clavigera kw1407]EFX03600.1 nuclear elongation and deformation protein 1 [Grosmannia clavigera kw1407]